MQPEPMGGPRSTGAMAAMPWLVLLIILSPQASMLAGAPLLSL